MTEGKATRSTSSSSLKGIRVLVVEDGWQVADALKSLLEQVGMIVAGPVATPEEARRLVAECSPELAVVDINLRGEMAYELMDWLHDRGTPVIVITGYRDLPERLKKYSAILDKPFTAESLFMALRRAKDRDRTP